MACKWVWFAYRALPLTAWRAFLFARHIDGCPGCLSKTLDDEAIRSLGIKPACLENEPPLAPFAAGRERLRALSPCWSYAYGFFLAIAILGLAVGISRIVPTGNLPQGTVTVSEAEDDVRVFSVLKARIGNESARPVVFKPGQPGMTIVWFEKTKN